jgi:rhamnosyltransferase
VKVQAIIVTFRTDRQRLDGLLAAVAPQCSVVVADNTDDEPLSAQIRDCVRQHGGTYLWMAGNRGIGAAQNTAISAAWADGADAVLLLDDDSMPAANLVTVLSGCRVPGAGEEAVFGANAVDFAGHEISNARRVPGEMPRCREMMSSGTLIRRSLFARVGPFDESLFIDCVDFDWGWRARHLGIPLHLCRQTAITHRLGEGGVAGVRFPSPVRHYYQFRNILRMLTRPHTPWPWRGAQMLKLPAKLVLMTVLMPEPRLRLRYALAGIRDALRGRSGPWQTSLANRGLPTP